MFCHQFLPIACKAISTFHQTWTLKVIVELSSQLLYLVTCYKILAVCRSTHMFQYKSAPVCLLLTNSAWSCQRPPDFLMYQHTFAGLALDTRGARAGLGSRALYPNLVGIVYFSSMNFCLSSCQAHYSYLVANSTGLVLHQQSQPLNLRKIQKITQTVATRPSIH